GGLARSAGPLARRKCVGDVFRHGHLQPTAYALPFRSAGRRPAQAGRLCYHWLAVDGMKCPGYVVWSVGLSSTVLLSQNEFLRVQKRPGHVLQPFAPVAARFHVARRFRMLSLTR